MAAEWRLHKEIEQQVQQRLCNLLHWLHLRAHLKY